MSTDWEKYSSPTETRARSKRQPPSEYGVAEMIAGEVRSLPGLSVVHSPVQGENRAHVDVIGDKRDPEVRVRLPRIARWVIQQDQPA